MATEAPAGESKSQRHSDPASLRLAAEERLRGQSSARQTETEADLRRAQHELEIHQVELEMQNEELRATQEERQTALKRYSDLYDFVPVGYFTLAADCTMRLVNLTGASLLGIERSRLVGKPLGQFLAETDRRALETLIAQVFARRTNQTCEVSLTRQDHSTLTVQTTATLLPGGKECFVVMVDITERKQAEAQLRQAQKMEVIGMLAGGVAHDFNTILAALLLHLGLLQQTPGLSSDVQESLKELEKESLMAMNLTRQLLVFGRREVTQIHPLELNELIKNLLKMLIRLLSSNIEVVFEPCPDRTLVEADQGMMEQVVMNLCINARDAMPKGGRLTLSTTVVEISNSSPKSNPDARPGRFVCLTVADQGCGMDQSVLKRIFEPFFTTKEEGKGTGLGLATIFRIAKQHAGWVEVASKVGKGSSFRFYIPVAAKQFENAQAGNDPDELQGGSETILFVEDERSLLCAAALSLRKLGYAVLEANNAAEALKAWGQHRQQIELVLTDMIMPGNISGLHLAQQLRKEKPGLKVIIFSEYEADLVTTPFAGQEITYFAKPYILATLARTVRRCLTSAEPGLADKKTSF